MIEHKITDKLSNISEIMADGFYFIHLRMLMEDMEDLGDDSAIKLITIVEDFDKLCNYIKNRAINGNKT